MPKYKFTTQSVVMAIAATSLLGAGFAFAETDNPSAAGAPPPVQQSPQGQALARDAGKLSMDGAQGYTDIALARLAIFDGRTADAKKLVDAADTAFGKAKSDHTVFVKAENALTPPKALSDAKTADGKTADAKTADAKTAGAATNPNQDATAGNTPETASSAQAIPAPLANTSTPKAWLPVDGEISMNEDFSADPTKAAALADANKSLANGDRNGAIAKMRLAQIDLDYVMAVVPLDDTINDVHRAATLIDGGKFYEASQQLRQVQDSTRYDVIDVVGTPDGAKAGGANSAQPATSAAKPATGH